MHRPQRTLHSSALPAHKRPAAASALAPRALPGRAAPLLLPACPRGSRRRHWQRQHRAAGNAVRAARPAAATTAAAVDLLYCLPGLYKHHEVAHLHPAAGSQRSRRGPPACPGLAADPRRWLWCGGRVLMRVCEGEITCVCGCGSGAGEAGRLTRNGKGKDAERQGHRVEAAHPPSRPPALPHPPARVPMCPPAHLILKILDGGVPLLRRRPQLRLHSRGGRAAPVRPPQQLQARTGALRGCQAPLPHRTLSAQRKLASCAAVQRLSFLVHRAAGACLPGAAKGRRPQHKNTAAPTCAAASCSL